MDESVQKHIEESLPKVGRYQHLADAMLRGAAITPLAIGNRCDRDGGTCAIGAMHLGLGIPLRKLNITGFTEEQDQMYKAYRRRYGTAFHMESNSRRFTREQIAARIAAL